MPNSNPTIKYTKEYEALFSFFVQNGWSFWLINRFLDDFFTQIVAKYPRQWLKVKKSFLTIKGVD